MTVEEHTMMQQTHLQKILPFQIGKSTLRILFTEWQPVQPATHCWLVAGGLNSKVDSQWAIIVGQ